MTSRKLDAVLPLLLRDHERFLILDRSLRRNFPDLNRCWVVAKDSERGALARLVPDDIYRVIPESSLIPEIAFHRGLHRLLCSSALVAMCLHGRFDATSWYVQQLVKLAIAERVETDFYLTLDSDVVCMKPVAHDDLIHEGRAIANLREEDIHPEWYAHSARVLGLARPALTFGVTPAVLSREAMLGLQDFLGAKPGLLARALAALFPRTSRPGLLLRSWRSYLLRHTPWTEYTLYHTYLESTGLLDRYHVRRGADAIYDNVHAVWNERDFRDEVIEAFMRGNAFFLVVQSNTGIPPEAIRERLAGYLE